MAYLKITSVPPGEAPAWVREKWVGLSLPLADEEGAAHTFETFGVLSYPKSRIGYYWGRLWGKNKKETGYIVYCARAIEVLNQSSPGAATWWRSNAPWVDQPGTTFMFKEGVGHVETPGAP
jgi:hypothetical protein